MKSDKRKEPRKPLRYAARIVLEDGSRKDCRLSDISESGARIEVEGAEGLSASFLLLLAGANGPRRNCTVIWRESGQVGVAFRRGAAAAAPDRTRGVPTLLPDDDIYAKPAPAGAGAGQD